MRNGMLGSGVVGQALGRGLAALGHEVTMGTREPAGDKTRAGVEQAGGTASAGTFAEPATFAEIAFLATLWSGTESALRLAGATNLAGKVVVDATNPLDFGSGVPPRLALGHTDSGGEQVQRWLPEARVVKAFNIVGNALHGEAARSGRAAGHVHLQQRRRREEDGGRDLRRSAGR